MKLRSQPALYPALASRHASLDEIIAQARKVADEDVPPKKLLIREHKRDYKLLIICSEGKRCKSRLRKSEVETGGQDGPVCDFMIRADVYKPPLLLSEGHSPPSNSKKTFVVTISNTTHNPLAHPTLDNTFSSLPGSSRKRRRSATTSTRTETPFCDSPTTVDSFELSPPPPEPEQPLEEEGFRIPLLPERKRPQKRPRTNLAETTEYQEWQHQLGGSVMNEWQTEPKPFWSTWGWVDFEKFRGEKEIKIGKDGVVKKLSEKTPPLLDETTPPQEGQPSERPSVFEFERERNEKEMEASLGLLALIGVEEGTKIEEESVTERGDDHSRAGTPPFEVEEGEFADDSEDSEPDLPLRSLVGKYKRQPSPLPEPEPAKELHPWLQDELLLSPTQSAPTPSLSPPAFDKSSSPVTAPLETPPLPYHQAQHESQDDYFGDYRHSNELLKYEEEDEYEKPAVGGWKMSFANSIKLGKPNVMGRSQSPRSIFERKEEYESPRKRSQSYFAEEEVYGRSEVMEERMKNKRLRKLLFSGGESKWKDNSFSLKHLEARLAHLESLPSPIRIPINLSLVSLLTHCPHTFALPYLPPPKKETFSASRALLDIGQLLSTLYDCQITENQIKALEKREDEFWEYLEQLLMVRKLNRTLSVERWEEIRMEWREDKGDDGWGRRKKEKYSY